MSFQPLDKIEILMHLSGVDIEYQLHWDSNRKGFFFLFRPPSLHDNIIMSDSSFIFRKLKVWKCQWDAGRIILLDSAAPPPTSSSSSSCSSTSPLRYFGMVSNHNFLSVFLSSLRSISNGIPPEVCLLVRSFVGFVGWLLLRLN